MASKLAFEASAEPDSRQAPPCLHGSEWHSSMSMLQWSPVHPSSHVHVNAWCSRAASRSSPVASLQPPWTHGLLAHSLNGVTCTCTVVEAMLLDESTTANHTVYSPGAVVFTVSPCCVMFCVTFPSTRSMAVGIRLCIENALNCTIV